MHVLVKFDIDNHAFQDDLRGELRMILEVAYEKLADGNLDEHKLRDSNGNTVGTAQIVEDGDE